MRRKAVELVSDNLARLPEPPVDPGAILGALSDPVLVIGADTLVRYANPAAENFFALSATQLAKHRLDDLVPKDSPVVALADQVAHYPASVSEHGIELATPRFATPRLVDLQASAIPEMPGSVVLQFTERTMAHKIDRQLTHRGAARSVTGMAAVLAHEVKNPLSGIRGAAQLLELSASPQDRNLTQLIVDEVDRIKALVDSMEVFSDKRPIERGPVNIHQVLEHVRKVAQAGFGRHVRFIERYDPSLPPVLGNRDQLVQVFLNLIKNAAEAANEPGSEIMLATAYRHGVRLAVRGTPERIHLPLEVTVIDNGPGVPEDLKAHLFDPFVTTKPNGTGLGLALVAKIIGDHGGVIECDSRPRRTEFNVRLPLHEVAPQETVG